MTKTILQQKLDEQRARQQEADQRVENLQSVRPISDAEGAIVEGIIRGVSDEFKEAVSQAGGVTPEIIAGIDAHVQKGVSGQVDDYETQQRVRKIVLSSIAGLGPIEPFVKDPTVEDIVVQRYDNIVVKRGGKTYSTQAAFMSDKQLIDVINRIVQEVGRQINLSTPKVDARLPDGSRVNATIKPISPDGATLTIRKFPEAGYSAEDYLNFKSLDERILELLIKCVQGKANLIVGGGVASGKTTLLNMLSEYIPEDELIVTIEDTCELRLKQKNVRRLEVRPQSGDAQAITIQELVKNALRMAMDRVIIGEARDGTIVDLFSAMSTGHDGSMSTLHCNNPMNMVNTRIPILYSMYRDGSFTAEGQALQIAESLDVIVHIKTIKSGGHKGRRVISHVSAVEGVDENNPQRVRVEDIFRFDEIKGEFYATGYIPERLIQKLAENNVEVDKKIFDCAAQRKDEE